MKNCCRCNVKKHREIKDGQKYITLDVFLDFGSLDKINHIIITKRLFEEIITGVDYFSGSQDH